MVYRSDAHKRTRTIAEALILAVDADDESAQLRAYNEVTELVTGAKLTAMTSTQWHMLQIECARACLEVHAKKKISRADIGKFLGVSGDAVRMRIFYAKREAQKKK